MGPLAIEQVLAAEAAAIHDVSNKEIKEIVDRLNVLASKQSGEIKRVNKDADERSDKQEDRTQVGNRKEFYRELGKLRSAALFCRRCRTCASRPMAGSVSAPAR